VNQVNQWIDIFNGPYSNLFIFELKRQIKNDLLHSLNTPTPTPNDNDDMILTLYFVALGIRNPISALYGRNTAMRKIVLAVFKIRTTRIFREGTDEQRRRYNEDMNGELERRSTNYQKQSRLRQILYLFNHHILLNIRIAEVTRDLSEYVPLTNEQQEQFDHLQGLLMQVNTSYTEHIQLFQREYGENPEEILYLEMQQIINQHPFPMGEEPQIEVELKVQRKMLSLEEKKSWMDIECPICYETIEKENICMTNCSHKFCNTCILQVIKMDRRQSPCCPCCRTKIEVLLF